MREKASPKVTGLGKPITISMAPHLSSIVSAMPLVSRFDIISRVACKWLETIIVKCGDIFLVNSWMIRLQPKGIIRHLSTIVLAIEF